MSQTPRHIKTDRSLNRPTDRRAEKAPASRPVQPAQPDFFAEEKPAPAEPPRRAGGSGGAKPPRRSTPAGGHEPPRRRKKYIRKTAPRCSAKQREADSADENISSINLTKV